MNLCRDTAGGCGVIVPIAGGAPREIKVALTAGEVDAYAWAPDGKSILYAHRQNYVGNIWSMPLDGKAPKKLAAFGSDVIFAVDISPDNRLAVSRGT